MTKLIGRTAALLLGAASSLRWLPPLLVRIFVGYLFYESGLPKIQDPERFAQIFAGWGIAYPHVSVFLAGYSEVLCGLLLIAGFATRIASIPLIIDMVVATIAVQMKRVGSFGGFVALDDPLYALALFWLLISGPGGLSVDYFIRRYLGPSFGIRSGSPDKVRL